MIRTSNSRKQDQSTSVAGAIITDTLGSTVVRDADSATDDYVIRVSRSTTVDVSYTPTQTDWNKNKLVAVSVRTVTPLGNNKDNQVVVA